MAGTIKEIAQKAKVSRGTVDRALNSRPGVNKEVADRIREIAHDMGYKPNKVAKALAAHGKRGFIGVVVNNVGNPFFDEVLNGINAAKEEISDFGIDVGIRTLEGYDPVKQLSLIRELYYGRIDALAITPVSSPLIRDCLNDLIASGVKVVCFNLDIADVDYLAYIGCDYFQSGKVAGEMIGITSGGKGTLGIIGGSQAVYPHTQRILGCESVLKERYPDIRIAKVVRIEDNDDFSFTQTRKMLIENDQIDLLFFSAAGTTGGLKAVAEFSENRKLKVYTFDIIPQVLEAIRDGRVISTIDQQPFLQGYQAIRILSDALLNNFIPTEKRIISELSVKVRYTI